MVRMLSALLFAASVGWGQEPEFRGGTRYVEIEVSVRHKPVRAPGVGEFFKWWLDSGPPFGPPGEPYEGLTLDDFTLFDNGRPRPIASFGRESRLQTSALPVPPGAFSNRTSAAVGESSTILLIDLLNTPFDLLGYAIAGAKDAIRRLPDSGARVAVYVQGRSLHVVHGLNDDPRELREAIRVLEETGKLPEAYERAFDDTGGILGVPGDTWLAAQQVKWTITLRELRGILRHFEGLPGRKNLVWLTQTPPLFTASLAMIERANVALYPVKVRGAGAQLGSPDSMTMFAQNVVHGGRPFFDAKDLAFAVETAAEDVRTRYVLGYSPAESELDGTFHTLAVKIAKHRADVAEVRYRTGYVASKQAPVPRDGIVASPLQFFDSPLEATGLGLVAQVGADAARADAFRVVLTVDLRDARLTLRDGRFQGVLEFAAPDPVSDTSLKTGVIRVDVPEERFADVLENGYSFAVSGLDAVDGELRLVVRDQGSQTWGSLRIPAP